nr:hypothetical protein [Pseudomonas sp. BP8]
MPTDVDIVLLPKPLALIALALVLAGCANGAPSHSPHEMDRSAHALPYSDDRPLQLRDETPCRKRGCDNHKLFFNPGTPEPSVNTIHRGW